jgi:hypothetical protein
MTVLTVFRRLRMKDLKIEDNLGYIGRPCLQNKKEIKTPA